MSDFLSPPASVGQCFEDLEVVDITVEGGGVARRQGQVVFLDTGLPGDRVDARITSVSKRVVHAVVERVRHACPETVAPWCPHFNECGACSLQHWDYNATLAWKERHVRETLRRIGRVESVPVMAVQPSPELRGFRSKMVYAFAEGEQGRCMLGLRKKDAGREIIEVTECGLQPAPAMDIVAFVRDAVNRLKLAPFATARKEDGKSGKTISGYLRFLVIHTPKLVLDGAPQVVVECITGWDHSGDRLDGAGNGDRVLALGKELAARFNLTGFIHSERRQLGDVAQGERIVAVEGSSGYKEQFGHVVVEAPYNAFLQTNTGAAQALYSAVAEEAALSGTEVVWDVYSGVGSIALFLADRAAEVHGFEIQAEAVKAARLNSRTGGYDNCFFHRADLDLTQAAKAKAPDVLIVDPPRAGMGKAVLDIIRRSPAGKLLYVSCDAATQARDIAQLAPEWTPVVSRPFDLFPYTPHVENLLVLHKK